MLKIKSEVNLMNSNKRIEALKDEAIAILVQADCDGRFLTEGENKRLQEIEEEIKKMNCWKKFREEVWQSVEKD